MQQDPAGLLRAIARLVAFQIQGQLPAVFRQGDRELPQTKPNHPVRP